VGALVFPYAQAIVFKPFLEKKLAALEADRGRLATIDQELDFLKFLKQSQPPYLDAIYLLARSAPSGTHLESLSMGRHQEISIRLKVGNTQQVTDFRSKLVDSGWFANVLVEEQAPTPDQHVSVRMSAALKAAESRKPITAEPPGKKSNHASPGGEPGFGMPTPEPMMMPPSQPTAGPAQLSPAPPQDGSGDTSTPPPVRRRGRTTTTPEP
jgi:hypothetical protein